MLLVPTLLFLIFARPTWSQHFIVKCLCCCHPRFMDVEILSKNRLLFKFTEHPAVLIEFFVHFFFTNIDISKH